MCGRYASAASTADLTVLFGTEEVVGEDVPRSWNIAPTDPVRAVVSRRPHGADRDVRLVRQLRSLRWGLVPSWAKDRKIGTRMINARVETVTDKPAFKTAAARRRCLLPADGYYEWQQTPSGKVPHFLHHPDGEVLALAGLYELWPNPDLPADDLDRWLWTAAVITQPATDLLGHIHDRSPVVVPADLHAAWLDCSDADPNTARQILDGIPESHLQPDVVSSAVNSVRNNGPDLIKPVDPTPRPVSNEKPLL